MKAAQVVGGGEMDGAYPPMERVTKKRRCPICGKPDYCLIAPDGGAAICGRVEEGSVKRCGEAGWLHILHGDRPPASRPRRRSFRIGRAGAAGDWTARIRHYTQRMTQAQLAKLTALLGVSEQSLQRLGAGWNGAGWTFPMYGADGRVVGIHVRYRTGRKAAESGSRNGLFLAKPIPTAGPLLICEGMSDTAAAMDLRFVTVGRPGCRGGTQALIRLARGRAVVVVADNDPPKQPGQPPPGQQGAEALARVLAPLCPSVRVIFPPANLKDLRRWLAAGLQREELLTTIETAEPVRVRAAVRIPRRRHRCSHGWRSKP